MKVLFVIDGLGTGGAERSLAELLPGLSSAGIRPIWSACTIGRREWRGGTCGRGRRADPRGATTAGKGGRLRRMLRDERPTSSTPRSIAAQLVGRLASIGRGPVVLSSLVNTPYAAVRLEDPNVRWLPSQAVRRSDGCTARRLTDHFHAITARRRRLGGPGDEARPLADHRDRAGPGPGRLGGPGSDRRARSGAAWVSRTTRCGATRRQAGVPEGTPLPPGGGGRAAIAIPATGRPHRGAEPGRRRRELEDLSERSGLGDGVRLLGHRDDVPDLLAAADVFAFPSLYEGLGGAVIEAMAPGPPDRRLRHPRHPGSRRGWAERRARLAAARRPRRPALDGLLRTGAATRVRRGGVGRSSRSGSRSNAVPLG